MEDGMDKRAVRIAKIDRVLSDSVCRHQDLADLENLE